MVKAGVMIGGSMDPFKMLIGVCAYNEENNIKNLLQNLTLKQNLPENCKIIVVCSGCTDRTPQIVKEFQREYANVELITEEARRGKASALNKIFEMVKGSADVLVLVNADALPMHYGIGKLVYKLMNGNAGAAFAQPVPVGGFNGLCYRIVRTIWHLHHIISLRKPKLSGELCVIRASCLRRIPSKAITDEPYIELSVRERGYDVLYAPDILVYIRCPTNVVELLKHRERIWAGHLQLRRTVGFKVSTSSFRNILQALPLLKPIEVFYAILGGFLEVIARIRAEIALSKGNAQHIWEPIRTTKTALSLP